MSEWTITDMTATTPAATPEPTPERRTARQDLVRVLTEWADRHGLEPDDTVVVNDDDGDLTVYLTGLTLEDGDIVQNQREYEYEATILVEVTVRGSVTARSEDTATEEAEAACEDMEFDIDAYGVRVQGWTIERASVDSVVEE